MRIAMFGHKRIPSREGGVEIVVEELSTRMVQRGYTVTCYNRMGHHVGGVEFDSKKGKEYKNVRMRSVWTVDKKGLAAVTSSFFSTIICALGKYDIAHIHAEGPAAFCWLPKVFGKKVICTIHGLDHQRAKWGRFARTYIMMGEKNAVRFADYIIVLSKNVENYFREKYKRETIYIPNGVNKPDVRDAKIIVEKYGINKDEYILFLGRLVPEKGIQYLIEAFREINTDKKLVIAGGSSDTDEFSKELKQIAADDSRIIFTGFVQGELLEELYSNAYIYTLPSDLEGMPLSLLEAMSYGNCCVVSDIAECVEVVEDKAVIFEKSNVSALREKLSYLCTNEDVVHRYKREASEFICNKFSWDDVVERTLKLYNMNVRD